MISLCSSRIWFSAISFRKSFCFPQIPISPTVKDRMCQTFCLTLPVL